MLAVARALAPALALALVWPGLAHALPLYAARSGRTCDNCHSSPTGWFDPPQVARRKCSLSCVACHVDPNGGGLRTVSGAYYGASTLPIWNAHERPWDDRRRGGLDSWRLDPDAPMAESQPAPSEAAPSQPAQPPAMADRALDPRGPGAPPADRGLLAFGRPFGEPAEMAWLNGRYDDLNADPLLLFGGDARFAFWSGGPLFFPMQADAYAAVHPMEHLTLAATVGARGRARSATFDAQRDGQGRLAVRDLWLMTHEWPLLSHLRVGRFLPAYGTRIADHTAYIRRAFGMSQEDPANRVIGAEIGFAANYPYVTASAFVPSTLDASNPLEPGEGKGAALSAGWRDLGWSVGGSLMARRRPLSTGGDTTDASLQWSFNPWFYSAPLPLTLLGEVDVGWYERPHSGTSAAQVAWYHQLAWTALNGVVARLRYDVWDPDVDVVDDDIHRPGVGLDLTIVPGLTLGTDARVGLPAGGQASADLFIQLHGWL